jgi:hypothetical protein
MRRIASGTRSGLRWEFWVGRRGQAWCQAFAILNPQDTRVDPEVAAVAFQPPPLSEQRRVRWGSCNEDIDPTTAGSVTVFVRDRSRLLPFEPVFGLASDGVHGVRVTATKGTRSITDTAPVNHNSWLVFLPLNSKVQAVARTGAQVVEGCGYDSANSSMQCTIGK